MSGTPKTQRGRILDALARGDGQCMDGFDMGHTAEIMYGRQADQIEWLLAVEQDRALRLAARDLEKSTRLLKGESGDKYRRSEIAACASRLRAIGERAISDAHHRTTQTDPDGTPANATTTPTTDTTQTNRDQ